MAQSTPQYFPNDLEPVDITKPALQDALNSLQSSSVQGIVGINTTPILPENEPGIRGTIFTGDIGIACAFLRLSKHLPTLQSGTGPDFAVPESYAKARSPASRPSGPLELQPGRPSPIMSPALGASLMRLLMGESDSQTADADLEDLKTAVQFALEQPRTVDLKGHAMGVDEVLYGRAGLLWALLELKRQRNSASLDDFLAESVPKLADAILHEGVECAKEYERNRGAGDEKGLPLMWPWIDKYHALGAMHGIAGILSILLDPTLIDLYPAVQQHYPAIAGTITQLYLLCACSGGHLPMSLPDFPSSRPSPLVQICHGTPGLLMLLAIAGLNPAFAKEHWRPEWLEAIASGSDVVWRQGLLAKGGGLCHGIAGNAYSLLLLSVVFEYGFVTLDQYDLGGRSDEAAALLVSNGKLSGDGLLAMGLAMLLECHNTKPFQTEPRDEEERQYRMPDNPFSLFEGLTGTVCAWADAIAVIRARLRKLDLPKTSQRKALAGDATLGEMLGAVGGFPCLGGRVIAP